LANFLHTFKYLLFELYNHLSPHAAINVRADDFRIQKIIGDINRLKIFRKDRIL